MYETPGEPTCPVKMFEKYISHLNPMCNRLWQRARDTYSDDDSIWYQNRPIGKSTLSNFMATICKLCNISTRYTNHCLRVSTINLLKSNFSDSDIMCISGHKSVESLKLYERTTEDEKEKMSDCITNSIINKNDYDTSEKYCRANSSISPVNDIHVDLREFDEFDLLLNSKEVQDTLDAIESCSSTAPKQPVQLQQQPNQHIYNFYGPVIIKQ